MFTTQLVTKCDELAALAGPWNELAGGEPLQSWNWLATWWKHYGDPDNCNGHGNRSSLHALAVYDRNALPEHQLVGIAPWYLDRSKSKRGVLRPLGSGEVCTDHLSLVCRPENATAVADAVAEHLVAHEDHWDRLDMPFVDANDPAMLALVERMTESDCLVSHHPAGNCWSFDLPATWDEYLKSLSRSHRRQLNKVQDRVVGQGRTECHVVSSPDQLEPAWNVLHELHQRRWTGLGESGVFASKRFHNFHREVVSRLLADGQLRMSWTDLDGSPISAEYHVVGPRTVYTYQSGIDSHRLEDSPGRLQYMIAIRRAVEDGYKHFDFLRGDEPYKAHFRAVGHPTLDLRIYPNRRIARLRGCMTHAAISFKRFVKRHVKPAQH